MSGEWEGQNGKVEKRGWQEKRMRVTAVGIANPEAYVVVYKRNVFLLLSHFSLSRVYD